MTENPWDHPDFVAWAAQVRNGMFPKMEDSAVNLALLSSGDPDVKLAVEIGYGIMLDKPLIVLLMPGVVPSKKLMLVADEILTVDLDNDPDGAQAAIKAAIDRVDP